MSQSPAKERQFLQVVSQHRQLLYKICYMYAVDGEHFKDLYQEVLANIWQGFDTFRGEASISTWLYRTAFNTCVTYFRRTSRHSAGRVPLESVLGLENDESDSLRLQRLRKMYSLISDLSRIDKALIMMWLDEKSYDEIASLTGLTRNNVATRLRRIKLKLIEKTKRYEY